MKKFNMINEAFICVNCGKKVEPAKKTARDHCPYCLHSKHVDINPGDRKCECHGLLEPIGVEKFKNSFKIVYKCCKCGFTHKNIAADDDNTDEIINLSIIKYKKFTNYVNSFIVVLLLLL